MRMQGADLRAEVGGAAAAAGGRATARLRRRQRPQQRTMRRRTPVARICTMPAAAFPPPLLTGRSALSSPAPRCWLPRPRTPRRPPRAVADPLQTVCAPLTCTCAVTVVPCGLYTACRAALVLQNCILVFRGRLHAASQIAPTFEVVVCMCMNVPIMHRCMHQGRDCLERSICNLRVKVDGLQACNPSQHAARWRHSPRSWRRWATWPRVETPAERTRKPACPGRLPSQRPAFPPRCPPGRHLAPPPIPPGGPRCLGCPT